MAQLEALPATFKKWAKLAKQNGVFDKKIHDLSILDSASKIKDPQFYALRVIWQPQEELLRGSDLCDKGVLTEAKRYLREWQAWKDYIEDIKINGESSSLKDIGTFSLVRYNQMRTSTNNRIDSVSRKVVPSPIAHRTRSRRPDPARSGSYSSYTPTRMPRSQRDEEPLNKEPLSLAPLEDALYEVEETLLETSPQGSTAPPSPESPANAAETLPSEDEQIVNMALILFLDAVTIYHPTVRMGGSDSPRWTIKRLQLKFGTWEARTDGFLRMANDKHKIRAILETKPYVRQRDPNGIQRQESAQMAAWIRQFPDSKVFASGKDDTCFRRLLISQDSEEIYLTIAEYDSAYVSYLIDDEQSTFGDPSLMTMKQYGPWRTTNHEHMEHLGPLVLAFTLQQSLNSSSQEDPFTGPTFDKP